MNATSDGNSLRDYFENHEHRLIHKWMHYFEVYERHFARFCMSPVIVLEFGVSHGGSLQMWKQYFGPQALIYGVDVDPRCAGFGEENITIITGDQEDRRFLRELRKTLPQCDIIIDDGGHTMKQQIATFEEMYKHLKEGGIYLCEDLHTSYWPAFGGKAVRPMTVWQQCVALMERMSKRGGRNCPTFIEYSKSLIDELHNAWHGQCKDPGGEEFRKNAFALHYYDSILVIEKRATKKPFNRIRGTPSWPLTTQEQEVINRG